MAGYRGYVGSPSESPSLERPRVVDAGCKIVCFWQGALEVSLRFVAIVLSIVLLVTAAISRSRIGKVDDVDPYDGDRGKYKAAAGWLIFVSVMAIVTESFIIGLRFLNITFLNINFALFGVVDVIASFVFAACMFAGWVPDAVYTADINDLREQCETQDSPVTAFCHQLKDVEHAMTATAIFGAFSMLAFLVLAIYMIAFIVNEWNYHIITSYNTHQSDAAERTSLLV